MNEYHNLINLLALDQFFYILDHEIETPAEDIYHVPQHGYPATLGVFHSLHCVVSVPVFNGTQLPIHA